MGVRFSSVAMHGVGISTISPYATDIHSTFDFFDTYSADTSQPNNGLRAFGPFTAYGHNGDFPNRQSPTVYTQNGKAQLTTGGNNGATVGLSMGQHGVFTANRKSTLSGRFDIFINSSVSGGWFFFGFVNTLDTVHSYGVGSCAGIFVNIQSGEFTTQRKLQNGQVERTVLATRATTTPRSFDLEVSNTGNSIAISINGAVQVIWPLAEVLITSDLYAVAGLTNSNTNFDQLGPRVDSLSLVVER